MVLIKARFVEMFGSIYDNKFGYNVRTLQDVCEPIKDGTHQTPTYIDDSINGFKFLSTIAATPVVPFFASRISKGIVAEIEINLPDKKEQQLSVDTLKKVWDVIVVRRNQ